MTQGESTAGKSLRENKDEDTLICERVKVSESAQKLLQDKKNVFVELEILRKCEASRESEWREIARWIRYEEDYEEEAGRWGKPHVASLSFHSLAQLRSLIESSVTLLNLEEQQFPSVAYRIVNELEKNGLINEKDKCFVLKSLLSKHVHVEDGNDGKSWKCSLTSLKVFKDSIDGHVMVTNEKRDNSQAPLSNIEAAFDGLTRRRSCVTSIEHSQGQGHQSFLESETQFRRFSVANGKRSLPQFLSEDEMEWICSKESILSRVPVGAEACIVLVGGEEHRLQKVISAFVRLKEAVIMPSITELPIPVRFICFVLGPPSEDMDYKEIGRSYSTLMSNSSFHGLAYKASDGKDLLQGLNESLEESLVLPPLEIWSGKLIPFEELRQKSKSIRLQRRESRRLSAIKISKSFLETCPEVESHLLEVHEDNDEDNRHNRKSRVHHRDPLERTGTPFGGLFQDIVHRYPFYWSDVTDGFNSQVVASILFIYFACVSGAIAFGGILSDKTEGHIGITETLMASAGSGLIFALLSGQPLIVIGTTGPLLLFDSSLYQFCQSQNIDYLGFRVWVGVWLAVIGTGVVGIEGSVLARNFTRFIQEIYSGLISLLFCWDSIDKLIQTYKTHPLQMYYHVNIGNGHNVNLTEMELEQQHEPLPQPNTALLTSILCLGTFSIAIGCREIRDSDYFTPGIRKLLGNFGVPIAAVIMCAVDILFLVEKASTDKLKVPQGLSTTKERDSWFIDPTSVPPGWAIAAVVPAFLAFILMFMETCICGLLIDKKEHKLMKGGGYHLDIFLVSFLNTGSGLIGGCWVCAATVRSVAHTTSLLVYSSNNAPGEKPKILGVKEQRISNLGMSVLQGLSVLMSPILVKIPMAVLFGIFLYMGISSMRGVQLFDRISLFFKQVSNHPQVDYVRRVKTIKMHLFTLIQVICLAILWGVKCSPVALAVPFVLGLFVPFRMIVMPRIFRPQELQALDS